MTATVVITTKNRKDELRVAIQSAITQSAKPEVLVIDDGSTDGTSELVKAEFPQARLDRVEKSLGLIVQRNRAAKLASGDVIFSIDDDAAFTTPNVVAQTLADFDHRRVGAVAIPFINVNKENTLHQRAPDDAGVYVNHDYIGTAHAVRRDIFLKLGGYRDQLVHQGEERDYCIRLLDAGYVVRLGRSDPIHHFESPRRDFRRMDYYGRRNDVLFAWHNVPWPSVISQALGSTLLGAKFAVQCGRPYWQLRGLAGGYLKIVPEWSQRHPVRRSTYQMLRKLKGGPVRIEEIEEMLPPIKS